MTENEAFKYFLDNHARYVSFKEAVGGFFINNRVLNDSEKPLIHSIKTRIKSETSFKDKIRRKLDKQISLSIENISDEVTDYVGVRVLHLYSFQAKEIDLEIRKMISSGDWKFFEPPKAYTWDPDSQKFFENMGMICEIKDSHYTSLHYTVRPNNNTSQVTCEIQVRTLFEEIWGEIDHSVNYPHQTENYANREQLRVLSKLISTGTRLADSIFNIHNYRP